MRHPRFCWILDSGGAGRGAWQGGVIHQFMSWTREHGCFPSVAMGASAGGYAAADVATGTEATVMKGWTRWGVDAGASTGPRPSRERSFRGKGSFRRCLEASIRYVMAEGEVDAVFAAASPTKLLVFTSRIRRRDGKDIGRPDVRRLFLRAATRKFPKPLKYLPALYEESPVLFAAGLPPDMESEHVRPLTRRNYHAVLLASCLVPLAMGDPVPPASLLPDLDSRGACQCAVDRGSVFIDGGYTMKMPMAAFEEDSRFGALPGWAAADKTIIFCCDPGGTLWETSFRLRSLNRLPSVIRALAESRLLVIYPDHEIEAGFLCHDNEIAMRTFRRGQEQADRLLRSDAVRRFLE